MSRDLYGVISINKADNVFFEAYKRLDNFCSDAYECRNGISEYIAKMEQSSARGQSRVPSWNDDYKKLKHVRWVRNRIAHNDEPSQVSEPADLTFVRSFHDRMQTSRDPLSLLRKANTEERKRVRPRAASNTSRSKKSGNKKHANKTRSGLTALIIGLIVLIILLLVYYFYFVKAG